MEIKNPESELVQWVKAYTKDMLSWAYARTSDLQTAEDLVQETFLAAAEKITSFKRESEPKTWLFGILNNKISGHFRLRAKHHSYNLDDDHSLQYYFNEEGHWKKENAPREWDNRSEHLLDNEDFNRTFENCLEKLPPQWFHCISMKYLDEKKTKDICQELSISSTNYWQIIHRAKLQVRNCLEQHWFND